MGTHVFNLCAQCENVRLQRKILAGALNKPHCPSYDEGVASAASLISGVNTGLFQKLHRPVIVRPKDRVRILM
jgi:hypothetical protein